MPIGSSAVISTIAAATLLAEREDVAARRASRSRARSQAGRSRGTSAAAGRRSRACTSAMSPSRIMRPPSDEVDVAHVLLRLGRRPRRAARSPRRRSGSRRPGAPGSAPAARRSARSRSSPRPAASPSRTRRRSARPARRGCSIFETSGTQQQPRAHVLDVVAQLAVREAVGREAVDDPVGVAELVVEEGPDDAARQRVADVADLLAHLVPEVGHLVGRRVAAQVDEDRRVAGVRVAAQEVEVRDLLELALEPLGDLQQRLVERRAGPARPATTMVAEREGGILVAAEREVGGDARGDRRRSS